jgi:hypothetical protein
MDGKHSDVLIESSNGASQVPSEITSRFVAKNSTKTVQNSYDYLDEYDNYYFEHEKYLQAGHGGKQRNKKEVALNSNKYDPSGNVRIIVSKMQNFEHNRRKSSSS